MMSKIEILKENMIVVFEPGIYFSERVLKKYLNLLEIKKYENIGGIRIEDTILIIHHDLKF